ncbi:hypothetical protein [Chitinophaga alhagiae]|uniref:hypothetical protein n=1 Tax=Chitinophaga alhagiae TaxID=2203219 RepID=UPI000E5ABFC3|nr:hypothetical protein [Chitinophaga alhagiae]
MKSMMFAAAVMLCITLLSSRAHAGGDYFKVYLNNKLIIEQHVWEPLKLQQLQLGKANADDELTFHYSHCGKLGSNRKIAVQDAKGKVIREWKFADAPGSKQSGMVITVKELLALQQRDLRFFYTATELPKGQLVGSFHVGSQTTSQVTAPAAQRQRLAALLPERNTFALL